VLQSQTEAVGWERAVTSVMYHRHPSSRHPPARKTYITIGQTPLKEGKAYPGIVISRQYGGFDNVLIEAGIPDN
jgi:hypothetical protein